MTRVGGGEGRQKILGSLTLGQCCGSPTPQPPLIIERFCLPGQTPQGRVNDRRTEAVSQPYQILRQLCHPSHIGMLEERKRLVHHIRHLAFSFDERRSKGAQRNASKTFIMTQNIEKTYISPDRGGVHPCSVPKRLGGPTEVRTLSVASARVMDWHMFETISLSR